MDETPHPAGSMIPEGSDPAVEDSRGRHPLRIGINLLPAIPEIGGGWQYAAGLMRSLGACGSDEYVVFTNPLSTPLVPAQDNFRVVEIRLGPNSRGLKVAYESLLLSAYTRRIRLDCMHYLFGALPLLASVPNLVTIFDLMVLERPQDYTLPRWVFLRVMRKRASSRATVVAPMSHATAEHIHRAYGVPRDRMAVIHPSLDPGFRPRDPAEIQSFRQVHGLGRRYFVYVASDQTHKNYDGLLAAYRRYREQSETPWDLVLRGATAETLDRQHDGGQWRKHVHLLPHIPDAAMPLLYAGAGALVYPSLFEGGGLPVAEALATGCPVAGSDIPTTHEFSAGAALIFDPRDPGSIADAMTRIASDAGLRTGAARTAQNTRQRFSDIAMAEALTAAYRRVARAI
jgi:glycosyltransferase involved in cell wall biosynthesis